MLCARLRPNALNEEIDRMTASSSPVKCGRHCRVLLVRLRWTAPWLGTSQGSRQCLRQQGSVVRNVCAGMRNFMAIGPTDGASGQPLDNGAVGHIARAHRIAVSGADSLAALGLSSTTTARVDLSADAEGRRSVGRAAIDSEAWARTRYLFTTPWLCTADRCESMRESRWRVFSSSCSAARFP